VGSDHGPQTDRTLLDQLKDSGNGPAWVAFKRLYEPLLQLMCRRWKLQSADVEEVTSIVLTKLVKTMPLFEYNPGQRFRGWLRRMVDNSVKDFLADGKRRPGSMGRDELATPGTCGANCRTCPEAPQAEHLDGLLADGHGRPAASRRCSGIGYVGCERIPEQEAGRRETQGRSRVDRTMGTARGMRWARG
jgi:hypothetical protein